MHNFYILLKLKSSKFLYRTFPTSRVNKNIKYEVISDAKHHFVSIRNAYGINVVKR